MNAATIVDTFEKIARPIMLRYIDRQTCIESTRITIEVMRMFQLPAQPVPVKLAVECRELKFAYVAGFSSAEKDHMQQTASGWSERGHGWNGHLLTRIARRWLVDSSIDQIQSHEHELTLAPMILAFSIPETMNMRRKHIELVGSTDEGQKLRIQYWPLNDQSFRSTPAWELDATTKFIATEIYQSVRDAI